MTRTRARWLAPALVLGSLGCADPDDTVQAGLGGSGGAAGSAGAAGTEGVAFERIELHSEFYNEHMAAGDFDQDGVLDVVAGPFWFAGPDFATRHEIYSPVVADVFGYSTHFFNFVYDVNGDAYPDVVEVGFPGQTLIWYENPRSAGAAWALHLVFTGVDAESPTFTDLTGDGRPELLCAHAGQLGWVAPDWADPAASWTFQALTPALNFGAFTHGLGAGDVDLDGRVDVLEQTGWWQQGRAPSGELVWTRHAQPFGDGGAQMHAYDVDGDGDNDVVTTWSAHGYGLSWFEQTEAGFVERPIAAKSPDDPLGGVLIHEPHALEVADVDGDGLLDLVTGQRFWGHVPVEPDFDLPSELYWFRLERTSTGARFSPELVDLDSGVGVGVATADLNGDARTDILVANKKGAFVFLQRADD
jgi:hypothetical protein